MTAPRSRAAGDALGYRLVRALSAARTAQAAAEGVLRETAQALDSPLGAVWMADAESGLLGWRYDWAEAEAAGLEELRRVSRRLTFAPGVGVPGAALEHLGPAWVEDIAADAKFPRADVVLAAGMRSVIAAPLLAPDGVTGVIEFFGRDTHAPTAGELSDVMMAGRQLGAYLGRLDVEHRLQVSEESGASIVRAALDCIVTMDHRGCVLDFNPAAEQTFGYSRDAAIGATLAELIIPPQYREAHERALARFLETRTATILGQRLELHGLRSDGTIFPVELTITRLGATEPPRFVGFIRDIGDRQALRTEQARLLHEAQVARADAERGRERAAFLAGAGRAMAESMDWEQALMTVVRSAVPAIADWCSLTVVEPDGRLRTVALAHSDPERERLAWEFVRRFPPGRDSGSGPGAAIRTGQIEAIEDLPPDAIDDAALDPEYRRLLRNLNVRHVIAAPLTTPAGVIGALTFVLGDSGRRFEHEDRQLITSLSARAALHIQNARLYTERSHIARTLQASLRPRALPVIPGAELAARFLPAGDQNEVGGDFYDVFPSGEQVWTAIVGDVSGKGARAAALTALARHTLRTASMLHDDPATNLALLNRAMVEDSAVQDFCTVLYARLCPGDGGIDVRFSNGGHPSPLLLRADGSLAEVETGRGPLVGAVADASFGEATLRLAPGDLLLLYTDGVTEIRKSDVTFGDRELRRVLAAHAGASAEAVVAAIERHVLELQDGAPRDDIALVGLKASG